jgi:hypothetical protein
VHIDGVPRLPRMRIVTLIALACLCPASLRADLVTHWKLDDSTADEVASHPAEWQGPAAYASGVAAPLSTAAADLNGTWLEAGTGINFERHQAFTASAWIKGGAQDAAVVGDMVHLEGYQGWELHVGTDANGATNQSVTVWLISDYPANAIQVNASTPVLDNQWHHVAFTYDGSSNGTGVRIYVDGVPVAVGVALDSLGGNIANGPAAELNIGSRMNGAAHGFTGQIDEVAIFNREMTQAEMLSIFSAGIESVSFPEIVATVPAAGQSVTGLTSAEVTFSFPVAGVDAADLLVNGTAATGVTAIDAKRYVFTFSAPPQGDVHFTWAPGHGIAGLNGVAAQPSSWSALFAPVLPAPQAAISEFLAQNTGGQYDEDFDTPDWIEIHNPGSATLDLAGWSLTDDPAMPRQWIFPSKSLAPGARILVFASGKDRASAGGELHTNFKLGAETGGYLGLFDPSGQLVHAYDNYPEQEGNVSFGLLATGKPSDGRAGWRYLLPTPGAAPSGPVFSGAAIMSTSFSPALPQPGQAVTVTMRTSPEANITGTPALRYRIMHGTEIQISFFDDGLHGDGAAGDRLWGAVIPGVSTAGHMIRWKIGLTSNGAGSRWPVNTNANAELPLYEGTVVGGSPSGAMPVYQFFVPNYTIPTSTSQTGIDSDSGARGAFFGNGKLYDNVLIRIKGTTSRYLLKRSHRVDFNPGRGFEWSPDYPAQRELNLNSEYNDPSYLRQNQQLWMHRDSGNAGSLHFPVKLLINNATWQLAFHSYSADSELVETMGLDPRGALYKQVGTLSTSSGAEKKSRKWEGTTDIAALRNGLSASASTRNRYLFDNLNLPAVINYLAVARIAQEGDDVWANMVMYRDSDASGEWRPIPFDLNLSFGQLFYNGEYLNSFVHATNDSNKSHPLYGSSSCLPNTGLTTSYNRLYNAVIQNSTTRGMLLRRTRTLMDRYLKAPGTSAANSPLEARFDSMGALILADANTDRAMWGLPPNAGAYGLGPGISPSQGLATLKSDFLAPRRTHFYATHSVTNTSKPIGIGNSNNAGIPNAQVANPVITIGTVEAHPTSGNPDHEYIELVNGGSDAVDVSDWLLRGAGGRFTLEAGTVIAPGKALYVSPDVKGFRTRSVSPKGNEENFVVGPYSGHLSPYGETVVLENATGGTVAQKAVAADPNAPPVTLEVTEIMSSSVHTANTINGDWWELTNTGNAPLDLAGFSWDDSRAEAGQAYFGELTLAPGESLVVLDEDDSDEARAFRQAWSLPGSVQVLTREDFGLEALRGLGSGDSVIVYLPNGTETARANYPAHVAGKSRMWFRNGLAVPGGYAQAGKYGSVVSLEAPSDTGSPGFAATDPATLTAPYDQWTAANDLWSTAALPDADPDGDGRTNRAEYAFGGDPDTEDFPPPATMLRNGNEAEWTIARRANDSSLLIGVETSVDLTSWSPVVLEVIGEVAHPTMAGFVKTTYRIPLTGAEGFFRARTN